MSYEDPPAPPRPATGSCPRTASPHAAAVPAHEGPDGCMPSSPGAPIDVGSASRRTTWLAVAGGLGGETRPLIEILDEGWVPRPH